MLEEGGDNVKSLWPLWTGLYMCYNGNYKKEQCCEVKWIFKSYLSSDYFLQLENMKEESLVIVDKNATVNMYPNLAHTACQAMRVCYVLGDHWIYV